METVFDARDQNAERLEDYALGHLLQRRDVQEFSLHWAEGIIAAFGRYWIQFLETPSNALAKKMIIHAPLRHVVSSDNLNSANQYAYTPDAAALAGRLQFKPVSDQERYELSKIGLTSFKLDRLFDGAIIKLTWLRLERLLAEYAVANAWRWPGHRLELTLGLRLDSYPQMGARALGLNVSSRLVLESFVQEARAEPQNWEQHDALLMSAEELAGPPPERLRCC